MAFGAGGGSPDEVRSEINVTPLVDVCLVLLIIFMVVTPMLQQGIDVQLPAGPHAEKKPGEQSDLIISVKSDGTIFVGQNWIPDKQLDTYLRAEYQKDPTRAVLLKADKRINFGKIRTVMRAANAADFRGVAILTENQMAGKQMAGGGQ
jgi:biopolymer transport protein TolR